MTVYKFELVGDSFAEPRPIETTMAEMKKGDVFWTEECEGAAGPLVLAVADANQRERNGRLVWGVKTVSVNSLLKAFRLRNLA